MKQQGDLPANNSMKRYRIGRFSLSLPQEMERRGQSYKVRFCDLSEHLWSNADDWAHERDSVWEARLGKVQTQKPPRKNTPVIISTRDFPGIASWMRGVLYYGFDYTDERVMWEALLATKPVALWLKKDAWQEYVADVASDLVEIAKAYKPSPHEGPWFFLEHGVIELPYLEQEELYVRFEDHSLGLKFEVKMNAVDEVEKVGLLARLSAAISSEYAPGVQVEKIHTGKRTAAKCEGEEAILRLVEGVEKKLAFMWSFQGREDNGEYPRIQLSMESDDMSMEEKVRVWNRIVDSMASNER